MFTTTVDNRLPRIRSPDCPCLLQAKARLWVLRLGTGLFLFPTNYRGGSVHDNSTLGPLFRCL